MNRFAVAALACFAFVAWQNPARADTGLDADEIGVDVGLDASDVALDVPFDVELDVAETETSEDTSSEDVMDTFVADTTTTPDTTPPPDTAVADTAMPDTAKPDTAVAPPDTTPGPIVDTISSNGWDARLHETPETSGCGYSRSASYEWSVLLLALLLLRKK